MPLVSVIVPTFRLGGLDLLKWSLDQQTFRDFELVLVDGLAHWRHREVEHLFANSSYPVKHLAPFPIGGEAIFPRDAHPRYRNTGIAEARGEVCVLWCDYVMAPPMVLGLFAHRFATIPGKIAVCGTHVYGAIEPQVLRLPMHPTLGETLAQLESLAPGDPRWTSAFTVDPEAMFGLVQTAAFKMPLDRQDPKLRMVSGTVTTNTALHMKNEAVRREDLLAVAGLDETYNDTKCADDLDLGLRLANHGVTFVLDKGIDVLIPDPHDFTPELRRTRSHLDALRGWETRRRPMLLAGETKPEKSLLLL